MEQWISQFYKSKGGFGRNTLEDRRRTSVTDRKQKRNSLLMHLRNIPQNMSPQNSPRVQNVSEPKPQVNQRNKRLEMLQKWKQERDKKKLEAKKKKKPDFKVYQVQHNDNLDQVFSHIKGKLIPQFKRKTTAKSTFSLRCTPTITSKPPLKTTAKSPKTSTNAPSTSKQLFKPKDSPTRKKKLAVETVAGKKINAGEQKKVNKPPLKTAIKSPKNCKDVKGQSGGTTKKYLLEESIIIEDSIIVPSTSKQLFKPKNSPNREKKLTVETVVGKKINAGKQTYTDVKGQSGRTPKRVLPEKYIIKDSPMAPSTSKQVRQIESPKRGKKHEVETFAGQKINVIKQNKIIKSPLKTAKNYTDLKGHSGRTPRRDLPEEYIIIEDSPIAPYNQLPKRKLSRESETNAIFDFNISHSSINGHLGDYSTSYQENRSNENTLVSNDDTLTMKNSKDLSNSKKRKSLRKNFSESNNSLVESGVNMNSGDRELPHQTHGKSKRGRKSTLKETFEVDSTEELAEKPHQTHEKSKRGRKSTLNETFEVDSTEELAEKPQQTHGKSKRGRKSTLNETFEVDSTEELAEKPHQTHGKSKRGKKSTLNETFEVDSTKELAENQSAPTNGKRKNRTLNETSEIDSLSENESIPASTKTLRSCNTPTTKNTPKEKNAHLSDHMLSDPENNKMSQVLGSNTRVSPEVLRNLKSPRSETKLTKSTGKINLRSSNKRRVSLNTITRNTPKRVNSRTASGEFTTSTSDSVESLEVSEEKIAMNSKKPDLTKRFSRGKINQVEKNTKADPQNTSNSELMNEPEHPERLKTPRKKVIKSPNPVWKLALNNSYQEITPGKFTTKKSISSTKSTLKSASDSDTFFTPIKGEDSVFLTPDRAPSTNNGDSIIYISPFVTSSRGKTAARKEFVQRKSLGMNSSMSSSDPRSPKAAANYFTKILNDEIERIENKCSEWQSYKQNSNLTEDACGLIDMTIGQSNLLISKKFNQFRGLIEACRSNDESEMKIQCEDLHGFWDMIYKQVDNLEKRFENLEDMKKNDWLEEAPKSKTPKKRKGKGKKKQKAKATTAASSLLKEAILAARKKKAEEQANLNGSLVVEISKRTPKLNKSISNIIDSTPAKSILKTDNNKSEKRKTVVFIDDRLSLAEGKENKSTTKKGTPLPSRKSIRISLSRNRLSFD
ncbi:hypothetical protein HHI36_007461 [Cryptolaemus montrouzieri]|uniref:Disks large-associated protein 5 n=1 Tax=Cryptolaemus montrouzieri TaxID=559131 RepID=A0ABD2MPL5_9CUCU